MAVVKGLMVAFSLIALGMFVVELMKGDGWSR